MISLGEAVASDDDVLILPHQDLDGQDHIPKSQKVFIPLANNRASSPFIFIFRVPFLQSKRHTLPNNKLVRYIARVLKVFIHTRAKKEFRLGIGPEFRLMKTKLRVPKGITWW